MSDIANDYRFKYWFFYFTWATTIPLVKVVFVPVIKYGIDSFLVDYE